MTNNIAFYLVFISQIILISAYYPSRILSRFNQLTQSHPPEVFPKLYAHSVNRLNATKRLFFALNTLALLIGLVIVAHLFSNNTLLTSNQLTLFMLLQYLPMLMLELSEKKQLKMMRDANTSSLKTAQLLPRKLLSFVSAKVVVSAALLYILLFSLTLYIEGIQPPWYSGYGNLVAITYVNVFLMALVFWKLYGKKQNPHANEKDRLKEMKALINVIFFTSICASIYSILQVYLNQFDALVHMQPVVTSVYIQLLAYMGIGYMLRSINLNDVDFNVYRTD